MSIQCSLHHKTSYHYERPVKLGPQVVRLRPAPHSRTSVSAYAIKIKNEKHFLNWQQDTQGNFLGRLVFPEPVTSLEIEVDLIADLSPINPFDFFVDDEAKNYPFDYPDELTEELRPFLVLDPRDTESDELLAFEETIELPEKPTINEFMVTLNCKVNELVGDTIRLDPGVQTPQETILKRTGSSRDSAWLLIILMRRFGIAARFCSGYLIQLKTDQKPLGEGADVPSEDYTDLHAWAEVYLPGAGWVGLDPTSGLLTGEGHIPLCATAHYRDAAPLSGSLLEADEIETEFDFDMKVERVIETPRVTFPYSDSQEEAIESLGRKLDQRLENQDMRLMMGGQPTFVSANDMGSAEWDTDILGPTKEGHGEILLLKLFAKFSPGGFLHHGRTEAGSGELQSKWSYSSHWRKDGQSIWTDPSLFARPHEDYGHNARTSEAFTKLLAKKLGLTDKYARVAFEDLYYYIWKERRLPVNVDPNDSRLDNRLERETIARIFEQGLGSPVGQILPLRYESNGKDWITGPWQLGSEEVFLHPGSDPMGYRLPLDGLPWAKAEHHSHSGSSDPSIVREPLKGERLLPPSLRSHEVKVRSQETGNDSSRRVLAEEVLERQREAALMSPHAGESAKGLVRSSLCVEPRDGRLNIFLPAVGEAEPYLELVAAVEETAKEMGTPVRIEGAKPPLDPRLDSFAVTPAPGTLEVKLHPSKSWESMREKTEVLYNEMGKCGLGTEKFRENGRHLGTGGGNHILVGGDTPLDSPFLRRPDLLRSVVTYFNNHPSLSYLFSCLSIGSSSNAPRLDEGRLEAIYELETAFSSLPQGDSTLENCQWVIDRVLRHHMTDVLGQTQCSEICIDKLFGSDLEKRLGIVEFRGFEMSPHPEMSLSQQLLIRGLLSRFWAEPYQAKLVRWGSSIHDKWMLPHYLKDDLDEVIGDLQDHGLHFDPEWYEPHLEFRFPLIGEHQERNVRLEIRQAAEPWNVLSEESSFEGTTRYLDSSVERVQVKVSNLTESRHLVTCNGVPVPLHATGRKGEFVAGVRYRAWAPFSALHPFKAIDAPLTFDLVDTWNEKSLGACQYHVVHPGGRSYDGFPLNGMVAESRRRSRFLNMGKTSGRMAPQIPEPNPEYPLTLDLQRFQ